MQNLMRDKWESFRQGRMRYGRALPCLHLGLALGAFFLAGCATVSKPAATTAPEEKKPAPAKGVYHKVRKGETLWRIARAYRVSVEEITLANHIPNAASIEENQLLLIPGADVVQTVTPVSSTSKDTEFMWPARGKVVYYFDDRRGASFNRGIDIKLTDEEFVKASRDGRVVFSDHLAGYGYAVILDHADGFYTVYGRGDKLLVSAGDYVTRGEKIVVPAREGGQAFLHFEIRKGSAPSNPLYYLP
ncbi:MAG: peptidoglycan DD-metalloendopeptidase family protein [Candidatus Omnitrophica bacterium]|nr:peptidoglycan DD-metalloendopeptidase family protein [Candidatus Omnitrophota bacterium]